MWSAQCEVATSLAEMEAQGVSENEGQLSEVVVGGCEIDS